MEIPWIFKQLMTCKHRALTRICLEINLQRTDVNLSRPRIDWLVYASFFMVTLRSPPQPANTALAFHVVLFFLSFHWNTLKCAFLHLDLSTQDGEEYKSEGIYIAAALLDRISLPVVLILYFFMDIFDALLFWFVLICLHVFLFEVFLYLVYYLSYAEISHPRERWRHPIVLLSPCGWDMGWVILLLLFCQVGSWGPSGAFSVTSGGVWFQNFLSVCGHMFLNLIQGLGLVWWNTLASLDLVQPWLWAGVNSTRWWFPSSLLVLSSLVTVPSSFFRSLFPHQLV